MCRLLSEGPKTLKLEDFVYLLKDKNKIPKIDLNVILKGLANHVPERDKHYILECTSWMDLIDVLDNYKIISLNEISTFKSKGKLENKGTFGNKNIQKASESTKKNFQCFICAGSHYSNNCPNKPKGTTKDLQNKDTKILSMNLETEDTHHSNELPGIIATINGMDTFLLVDSGATNCFISEEFASELNLEMEIHVNKM